MRPLRPAVRPCLAALLLFAALLPTAAPAQEAEECVVGNRQSPIVLGPPFTERDTVTLSVDYPVQNGTFMFNTGLQLQVNFPESSAWLQVGARRYRLVEFHFHYPVEHRLAAGGLPGEVEIHFVHADGPAKAVLATFVRIEGSNATPWMPVLGRLPAPGDTIRNLAPLDLRAMLVLTNLAAEPVYRYDGSLTTPAYCEGVAWVVRQRSIRWSQAQREALERVTPQLRRLPMPRHGRPLHRRN
ncbi:MAG TPA: carbonic anhydrase family protein [Longimicrobiaceae bacterium]|nr:carbonic anhydrase family protein [Longimicrobiaceae bacterium]